MLPNFQITDELITKAAQSRFLLYEHEVYDMLAAVGIGATPSHAVLESSDGSFDQVPGDKLVLKILHPRIAHKSDVGGVRIVSREQVGNVARAILDEVPAALADLLTARNEVPDTMKGLPKVALAARLKEETFGVLVSEFVDSSPGFGNELFFGMRLTREFGPIINCGLGGLDTELYSIEITPGRAGVIISPGITSDADFFNAFKSTIPFETLTGLARGHRKILEPERIADLLARFHALVWKFSPLNPDARFWLTEFEMNPLVIEKERGLVPIDGLLRFEPAMAESPRPPIEKIAQLLNPNNICVIGVSAKSVNLARVILRNLLHGGFKPERLAIVKEGETEVDGVKCFPALSDLPAKYDLMVLSIPAIQVPDMVARIIELDKAHTIILITGGMGEKSGGEDLEKQLAKVIADSRSRPDRGPVMVGPNSLGVISRPGGYDTTFASETKLPRNPDLPLGKRVALLSQSGAFMVSRMSKLGGLLPRYAVSTGNEVDLGVADFLEHLSADNEIQTFGCYIEGFKNLKGLEFAETARKLVSRGKDVIVYKAGRSIEGRNAASGHTASIAGDWAVAEAVLSRAGCIVAHSFTEWANLLMLAGLLGGRPVGQGRLAAISNAGYETVGMADNLRGLHHHFEPAQITNETRAKLEALLERYELTGLVNLTNPIDLTPMATDRTHIEVLQLLASDPNVDVILHSCVPLSHMMKTLPPGGPDGDGIADPDSFPQLIINAFREVVNKPMAIVIDSGVLYDPMADMLMSAGVPVFRSADEAVQVFGRWVRSVARASSPQ